MYIPRSRYETGEVIHPVIEAPPCKKNAYLLF
jgi:hypothetical protein